MNEQRWWWWVGMDASSLPAPSPSRSPVARFLFEALLLSVVQRGGGGGRRETKTKTKTSASSTDGLGFKRMDGWMDGWGRARSWRDGVRTRWVLPVAVGARAASHRVNGGGHRGRSIHAQPKPRQHGRSRLANYYTHAAVHYAARVEGGSARGRRRRIGIVRRRALPFWAPGPATRVGHRCLGTLGR
jgi:hypothetical protein